MNKRLLVQLILHPDCRLIAVDNSDYNRLGIDMQDHVMVDYLVYNEDKHPVDGTLKLRYEHLNRGYYRAQFTTEYNLPKDGTYSYYKMLIPILEHFSNGQEYFKMADEMFYFSGKVYLVNSDAPEVMTEQEVFANSKVLSDCMSWYDTVHDNKASQTFYLPAKKIFSVCKLNRCLALLQKRLLGCNNPCKNLGCDKNTETEYRNFLFSAMYVFDYLKDIGNFSEAQRILDNLSSCNFICDDLDDLTNNDCGCGNS